MIRYLVIGAGIKGCAIAAMLSTRYSCVTLIEKDRPCSGATSTNHGRLHLGVSSWRSDSAKLTRRRMAGAAITRAISDVCDSSSQAFYIFPERSSDRKLFEEYCESREVPCEYDTLSTLPTGWLRADVKYSVFNLPEFGFNPAQLSARFVSHHLKNGGKLLKNSEVTQVRSTNSQLAVDIAGKKTITADVVINAASRWSDKIKPMFPDMSVDKYEWRIMCCKKKHVLPLESVLSVIDSEHGDPSIIPHGNWITFDCKTNVKKSESVDGPSLSAWGKVDDLNYQDLEISAAIKHWFPPLDLALEKGLVSAFTGVHGRLSNAVPGSSAECMQHPDLDGYWLSFGGQASTAVLDAKDVIDAVCDSASDCEAFLSSLTKESFNESRKMIWENY